MSALVGAVVLATAGPAGATGGTWGAGQWPYENGVLCSTDTGTSPGTPTTGPAPGAAPSAGVAASPASVPLVAWDLGPQANPAFLAAGVQSVGGGDSAVPPFLAAGGTVTPLGAGAVGLSDSTAIAATAYLISRWGSDPDPTRVAEVSALVAAHAGAPLVSACLASGQGGISASTAGSMWQDALRYAGPYHLTVTAGAGPLVAGRARTVRATVTAASGAPVPGVSVGFAAAATTVASPSATTDATGVATTSIRLANPTTATATTITASIDQASSLQLVQAPGAAPAVALGPGAPVTATSPVAIDQHADPVVATSSDPALSVTGAPVQIGASVVGLNGHTGTATISVAGPVTPPAGGCAALTSGQWQAAIAAKPALVAASPVLSVSGDGALLGPRFTPRGPGCYATSATVTTADATPNVTRTSAYATSLTVLPTTVVVSVGHGGLSPAGPVTTTVTVTGTSGATGSFTATLLGPQRPVHNSCDGLSWGATTTAAIADPVAAPMTGPVRIAAQAGLILFTRDGHYPVRFAAVRAPGCYAVAVHASLTVAGVGTVGLDTADGAHGSTVLVLAPSVQVATAVGWVNAAQPMPATVQLDGALAQAGTLTSDLLWTPTPATGCRDAKWATARRVTADAAVSVVGDGSYRISSPPTVRPGCYSLIATFTMDADNAVTSRSAVGASSSVFLATGVKPAAVVGPTTHSPPPPLPGWAVLGGAGLLILVAVATTVGVAWTGRYPKPTVPA